MSTIKYRSSEHVHTQRETNWPVKKVIFSDLTQKQKVAVLQTLDSFEVFSETNLFNLFLEYYSNLKTDTVLNRLVKLLRENFEEETVAEAIPMVSTATGLQKVTEFNWDDLSGRQQVMVDQRWPIKYGVLDYKKPLLFYIQEKLGFDIDPNYIKEFAAFINSYAPEVATFKDIPEEEIPVEVPAEEEDAPANNCRMCGCCMHDEGTLVLNPRESQFLDSAFDLMLKKVSQILLKPEPETISITWSELSEAFPKEKFAGVYKQYLDDKWEVYAKRLTDLFENHLEK